MRISSPLLVSSVMTKAMTSAIAVILLASNFTIINAQQLLLQQQQLTSQPGQIENGIAATAATTTTATTFQSTNDSFSVQVPQGWVIHDLNNTGLALLEETRQGYGMLAQLCPEGERQQEAASLSTNASGSSSANSSANSNNSSTSARGDSCQGSQGGVVHIIRYPDLETRIQPANNVTAYHLQKLQEVGYSGIQTVNNIVTTVNITNPQTNQTIATVPAKLVEMTYNTNFAHNQTRTGYFILAATNVTAPNLGTTKGYSVFYEGNSTNSTTTAAAPGITTTSAVSGGLVPTPLPPAVVQIFYSFELIVAPEVAQALAQRAAAAQATELGGTGEGTTGGTTGGDSACDSSYPDVCIPPPPPDLNCDDISARNFEVLPPDPHGFDGNDNDGIGCESGSNVPDEQEEEQPEEEEEQEEEEQPPGEEQPEGGEGEGNGGEDGNGGAEEGGGENGNEGEGDVDAGNGEGGGSSNDDARVQGRGASGPADDYG
jgi:hypothetical protein